MNRTANTYKALVEKCHKERKTYKETHLSVFSIGIGSKSRGKLLVVGRATNGWGNGFSKSSATSCGKMLDEFLPKLGKANLDWVSEQWGHTKKYNTKRSAFWRVARMLAQRIANDSDDCINHICWTNLYKTAPDGGNPSSRLKDLQFDHCAQILTSEIRATKAKNVVFLTGLDWAGPFLDSLKVENRLDRRRYHYVEFSGQKGKVNYVVGKHPQGKPEDPHFREIIRALERTSSAD